MNNIDMKFFDAFTENGWQCILKTQNHISADSESIYKLTVLWNYDVDVYAVAHTQKQHLALDGYYGVAWLEAHHEYESENRFLSWQDMDDMRNAIICAENNLVKLGIPFVGDYEFHGDNKEILTELNQKTRAEWNLEEEAGKAMKNTEERIYETKKIEEKDDG